MENATQELLSKKEVASLLKITVDTVHAHTKKGILKPYKFPSTRKIYYKKNEVLQALTVEN